MSTTETFEATPSFLGYYYQALYALVLLLKAGDDYMVSLETDDDVTLESTSERRLFQLKHSLSQPSSLTVANDGLWKTLRIWSRLIKAMLPEEKVSLHFVTTNPVGKSSQLQAFTDGGTDRREVTSALVDEASRVLVEREAAKTKGNKPLPYEKRYLGCEAFLALSEEQKKRLVSSIVIQPRSFDVTQIQLQVEVQLSVVERNARSLVAKGLIDWWDGRIVTALLEPADSVFRRVTKLELLRKTSDLQADYRSTSLPGQYGTQQPSTPLPFDNALSKQIDLVDGGDGRKRRANLARWQAMTQRDNWIAENLTDAFALKRFDDLLELEWRDRFEPMQHDCLGKGDDIAIERGKVLLDWSHLNACNDITPAHDGFRQAFIIRGSLQELSNNEVIGWHPSYRDILRK